MEPVAQSWIDNHAQSLVSEGFVEVSIGVADPKALEDASAGDNGHTFYANTAQVVSEVDKRLAPYATLERNLWLLDGGMPSLPASKYGDTCYVGSVLSGVDGAFTSTPTISIAFSQAYTRLIPGLTITWSITHTEYPTAFTVTAYNGETITAKRAVTGNSDIKSIVELDIPSYNRIDISIQAWCLPSRRARCETIYVGIRKVYDKLSLMAYRHVHEVDPLSLELPKSEIQFEIDNSDSAYDPNNPTGSSRYLMIRQEVRARYGYRLGDDVQWIRGGTFYLSEWNAPQNGLTAHFAARDLLEFAGADYIKGMYAPGGRSLYDLALDVLRELKLPLNDDGSDKWLLDDRLKTFQTKAPLPVCPHAECLQLIANAGGCALYQDRAGSLRIEPVTSTVQNYAITLQNSYEKSEIELSKQLRQVDTVSYQYFKGDAGKKVFDGDVRVTGTQEVVITYSKPAMNPVAQVTGGTLVSAVYYTNACMLKITATGDVHVTVTGDLLDVSEAVVSVPNGDEGETLTVKNELITDTARAQTVGTWVRDYYRNRRTLRSNWRADPRLDPLDLIHNANKFGENMVRMSRVELAFNGAFRGTGEGRAMDG